MNNTIRVSNSLDPDQARHLMGSDLDPNCLQRLSADDTSRQRVKSMYDKANRMTCALQRKLIQHGCKLI